MGLFDLLKQNTSPATSGLGQMTPALSQLTEAEMAALKFEQMKRQIDEMSRMRQMTEAYGMNPNAVMNMQQMNPMGNTMQNIPANVGGMSARNAQPPMDINTLLRALGYR
jgi:hypothetical protein